MSVVCRQADVSATDRSLVRRSPTECGVPELDSKTCTMKKPRPTKVRLKQSKKLQQYADNYLLLNYLACFVLPSRPSSGVHNTVVAASGTDHTIWGANKGFFGHV